jgi:hypothetical protein
MAQPCVTTVTIDGTSFDAFSVNIGLSTSSDGSGMPVMGSLNTAISVQVDMHDDINVPFSTVKKLFDLANVVTRDKIKNIKVELWKDESRQDALASYSFKGWISNLFTASGGADANHTLTMSLQPAMNQQNFSDLRISN